MQTIPQTGAGARAVRYVAAVLAVVAGLIHLWVAPEHFEEAFEFGVFFVAVGIAQIVAGILLVMWPSRLVVVATILGTLVVLVIYAVSRTIGLPFGPRPFEREGIGTVDVISKATEIGLLVALTYLAGGQRLRCIRAANPEVNARERREDTGVRPAVLGEGALSHSRKYALAAFALALPLVVAALVLAACDNGLSSGSKSSRQPYEGVPEGKPPNLGAPVPNPKEVLETKPAGQLPDFLSQLDGAARVKTAALYKGAMDHYDVYSHIPCYCGCAVYQTPHKSLAECFIKEKEPNSEITFTDHSLTCDLCQSAAKITVDGIAKGMAQKDIRASVYNKLKYTGIWTDTPPAP